MSRRTDLECSVTRSAMHLSEEYRAATAAFAERNGLSLNDFAILAYLQRLTDSGVEVSPTELRAFTGLSASGITYISRRLIVRELVWRETRPADRRSVAFHCTAQGTQLVSDYREHMDELMRLAVGAVVREDGPAAHRVLRSLIASMITWREHPPSVSEPGG